MRKELYSISTDLISRIIGSPLYLIVFVSDVCPNSCLHCWYSSEWKERNLTGNPLTVDEYEQIAMSIPSIHFLSITGGEAFLRPDLPQIIDAFIYNSKIRRLDVPTSGFDPELITEKAELILLKHRDVPFRIDVSLDGLEEIHNEIRRNKTAFQNAIETIKSLQKLKERFRNFDISIITTVSDTNSEEIEPLSDFISRLLPNGEWMVNIARGGTPDYRASKKTAEAYVKANEIISRRLKNNNFTGDRGHNLGKWLTSKNALRRELIMEITESKRAGGGCSAGSLIGVLFNDGQLRACETLDLTIGNVRDNDYDLPKMWISEQASNIRKEIQASRCICTHECFLSLNILMQPSCWLRLFGKRMKV